MSKFLSGTYKTVEILHIDTEKGRDLYETCRLSAAEKQRATSIFKKAFRTSCQIHGGELKNWAGDGGFAYFDSSKEIGRSVDAAKLFLEELPSVNAQTARTFSIRYFSRRVRIKARRGEIYGPMTVPLIRQSLKRLMIF